jgi:hypothetical protein
MAPSTYASSSDQEDPSKDRRNFFPSYQMGVVSRIIDCDIADPSAVKAALSTCRSDLPPLGGFIHAAMILRDSVFENMAFAQWEESLRQKVNGS